MKTINPVLQRQHFATIEAMLIHKGVCRAKLLGAALCLSSATVSRIRNEFYEACPEAVVPTGKNSKRGWARASCFTPRYLNVPEGMTQDQAAQQHLRALDIIRGTNYLAKVESNEPIIPIVAPIILIPTLDGMRYVFVEHARTLIQPKLNEFTTEELELLTKFPSGSRFAMRLQGKKRYLTCIGSWLENTE